jgi:hypothetical protein
MSKTAFAGVSKASNSFTVCVLAALLAIVPCSCCAPEKASVPHPGPDALAATTWAELWEQTPYPYTTPLPPAQASVIDGTYRRIEPTQPPAEGRAATPTPPGGGSWMWHPVRPTVWVMPPAPYSVQGGGWTLSLENGIFRIGHDSTGWHTLGSFTVSGNRIAFFNDPQCMEAVGRYEWRITAGRLALELVEDECGGHAPFLSGHKARAAILSGFPWMSH